MSLDGSTYNTVYNFCAASSCTDGKGPHTALLEDASGNLYGTTAAGGLYGNGVVYELALIKGVYTYVVLDNLNIASYGAYPEAPLIFGAPITATPDP